MRSADIYADYDVVYSAITDFVLAALPWKVFMSLQIKKDERVSLAVAMSVGAM